MADSRIVSRADIVFETLENKIIGGEYAPGTLLNEQKISEQLGVSRTPVREALTRLRQAELVHETGKGLIVLGITRADVEDIYEIRARIEGLAAERCAINITDEQLKALSDLLDMEDFYASKGTGENSRDLDSEFHERIYIYSDSPVFRSTLLNLHKKIQKYRKLSIHHPARAVEAAAEHRKIFEALKAHDPKAASAAALYHVTQARSHVLEAKSEEER